MRKFSIISLLLDDSRCGFSWFSASSNRACDEAGGLDGSAVDATGDGVVALASGESVLLPIGTRNGLAWPNSGICMGLLSNK